VSKLGDTHASVDTAIGSPDTSYVNATSYTPAIRFSCQTGPIPPVYFTSNRCKLTP